MSIEASCHCGTVRLVIDHAPQEVTECNCSICRRYGVLWAYYSLSQVALPVRELTETYEWDDRSIEFRRCRKCGCVTHWFPVARSDGRMGVNARTMDPEIAAQARVRRLDGAVTERYVD